MEKQPSEPEYPKPVWECLRERLEQMRVAQGRKSDPEARAKKLADRAKLVIHKVATAEPANVSLSFLAITKSRQRYGIPLEKVLEVQALDQFSPVPGAPAPIRGVVHWRGAILALLDVTKLFEIAETGLSDLHAYVVVEAVGKHMAVAVSAVDDIMSVPRHLLKPAPELPGKIAPEWVLGVHDENRLILQMDELITSLHKQPN